jgi:diguanylate cyclase (GGDEF)-like protein
MSSFRGAHNFFGRLTQSGIALAQALLAVVFFTAIWAFTYVAAVNDYDSVVKNIFRLEANLLKNFEEHVRRNLLTVDENLLFFKAEYEKHGSVTPAIIERMEKIRAIPAIQILMLDRDGFIMASRLPLPRADINGANEDFFQAHIAADNGQPFVAKPQQGRVSNKFAFHVSRRLNAADGSFAGIVTIAVDPDYFATFFNQLDLGKGQLLLILGQDAIPRVFTADNIDQDIIDFRSSSLIQRSRQADSGSFITTGIYKPGERLLSYRVMPDYPLILAIGISREVALADYYSRARSYLLGAAGLSFLILLAFAGLIQATLSRQRAARLQGALYQISEAAASATNLSELYRSVHTVVSELIWSRHFIISLYDEKKNIIEYAYFADDRVVRPAPRPFAKGMTEYVIRTGRPLRADKRTLAALAASGEVVSPLITPEAWLGVPLKASDGKIFGLLVARAYQGEPGFTQEDQDILTFVSRQVAMAIERKRADENLIFLSQHDALTGLYNRAFFQNKILALEKSRRLPIAIIVCDVDGLKLVNDTFGHSAGDDLLIATANIIGKAIRRDDLAARVGGDEFAIIMPGAGQKAAEDAIKRLRTLLPSCRHLGASIPLSLSIGYQIKTDKSVSIQELLLEADKRMYYEKLHHSQSVRNEVVDTIIKRLEVRDFMTEEHAARLQDLAAALARKAGLPDKQLDDIRLLAKFHDIGKVGIADRILFKHGPLTAEERKEVQRHCDIGYRIAKISTELAPIADSILRHQEWWNGHGYPLGLAGDDIPIEARIIAIVAAYSAMTSNRPYRQARSHEEAVAELVRCAGQQFDPQLVELFLELFPETNQEN